MDRRKFLSTCLGVTLAPGAVFASQGLLGQTRGPLIDLGRGTSLYEMYDFEPEQDPLPRSEPSQPQISLATGTPTLRMWNVHTDEQLAIQPVSATGFNPSAISQVNHFMRDWRRGEPAEMDPNVVLGLLQIQERARQDGFSDRVRFLSGYRSRATNDALRAAGAGAARNSLHIQSLAIDFSLPGVGIRQTVAMAKDLGIGGVGGYPSFVHIDTGRVRYWGSAA